MAVAEIEGQSQFPADDAGPAAHAVRVSKKRMWMGRILTGLAGLFLLFDAVGKLAMPGPVVDAFKRLGIPVSQGQGIAILLIAVTATYLIPRTAVLGAVLATGFLGGAVAIQMRAGSPVFETIFPVLFGMLVWAGVYLREDRLGCLMPLRGTRR